MQKKYIPNILSVIRMCLIPVFVCLFFWDYPKHIWYAVLVFFIAGATDVVDGYLARKNNWVSNLGKVLDPLADKLMQCTVLVCFYIKHIIPVWLLAIYVAKELLILVGSMFVFRQKNIVVKSSFCGKLAVCVFYASIAALLLLDAFAAPTDARIWTIVICVVMIAFATGALVQYFRKYIRANKTK